MSETEGRVFLSGNEAVALAALHLHFALGTGYPGTPSTEILERFSELGGKAQWAPNEKVALEVALGAAFGGARAIATMKHVGLNVAADPLFTAAHTGVCGALVVVSADDPGMASSQNEQDNRRYAVAASVPMLEPADSQEAYDFLFDAVEISERWGLPVLFRLTTRVCHSKTIVQPRGPAPEPAPPRYVRDIRGRVMIPANARPAHRRLREKLTEIQRWNETSPLNATIPGDRSLGIVASGAAYPHAREAAPEASFLKLGMTHPLPIEAIRRFAQTVQRVQVIEEGDPYLADSLAAAGLAAAGKPEVFHLGELNVSRVRRILVGDDSPEPKPPPGKPPQLCPGCPHRAVFQVLGKLGCIAAGDIGCYTLGVLPPFEAMDSCVCMGASIGVGLGLRHVLPEEQARKVVSVIGDSTFVHSGITGLVEMIYNPPATGHVILILDNGTTAMTGLQEHPGTGRTLDHTPTGRVVFEDLARALGVTHVHVTDPTKDMAGFEQVLVEALHSDQLSLIIARRPCLLAAKRINAAKQDPRKREAPSAASASKTGRGMARPDGPGPDQPPHRHRSPASDARPGERGGEGPASTASAAPRVTSVVIAGLGGQGVIKASDILAEAAFAAGLDVKKSELHGMSQRGGSVTSDVRFGPLVFSPMVPAGEADCLVVLAADQVEPNRHVLRPGGLLISPDVIDESELPNRRSLNVAFLGVLSAHLPIDQQTWLAAIRANLPEKLHAANEQAFELGRRKGQAP